MKDLINSHFDLLIVAFVGILLVVAFVYTREKSLETLMTMTIGGLVGLATRKTGSTLNTGDDTKISVGKDPQ